MKSSTQTLSITLLLIIISVSFISCSEDHISPQIPLDVEATSDDYDDIAEDFAATLADSDEGIVAHWNEFDRPVSSLPDNGSNRTRALLDTVIHRRGLTITIDRTFYDADSNASETYDSLSTVRMTRSMTIIGERVGEGRRASINHSSFHDINGIAPQDEERTVNGNGIREVESHFVSRLRQIERSMHAVHRWSKEDIVINRDRENFPYPLSGLMRVNSNRTKTLITPNRTREVEIHVEFTITFNGTRYAFVEMLNGPDYWIDLDNGRIRRNRPGDE